MHEQMQRPVVQRVVAEVAAREGVADSDLTPPLQSVVDTDALAALVRSHQQSEPGDPLSLRFAFCGYWVTVRSRPSTGATDDVRVDIETRNAP